MGTPAIVSMFEGDDEHLVTLRFQYDGGFKKEGEVGNRLIEYLKDKKIGIPLGFNDKPYIIEENPKSFSDSGDLAAWLITKFKTEPGNVRVYPNFHFDDNGEWIGHLQLEHYAYKLSIYDNRVSLSVFYPGLLPAPPPEKLL